MTAVIRPTISYTVANAKSDVGNPQGDLTAYLKKSDYETDKESLVSDEELTATLSSYATNTNVENALSSYATKTLLNETVSDRPTFAITDAIAADVSTLTDQIIETQSAKANAEHTHNISEINELTTTLAGKAASTHAHAISDITDLTTSLAGKAASSHSHAIADITSLSTTLAGKASSVHTHTMNDITDLTVSSHTHVIADIDSLTTTLAGKANSQHTHEITQINDLITTLADKASYIHEHRISQVNGLSTALEGKAASDHTHPIADIDILSTTLANKAAATHEHLTSDITDLSIILAGKANSQHSHNISDINNLSTTLAGKAASSHTHTSSQITDAYTSSDVNDQISLDDNHLITALAVFQMIYPIGAIYISTVDLPSITYNAKYVNNGVPKIAWMGCVWTPITSNSFLRSCSFSISGDTWSFSGAGGTGGSNTHTNEYGIKYYADAACIVGLYPKDGSSEGLALKNGSSWKYGERTGSQKSLTVKLDSNVTQSRSLNEFITTGDTSSSSNLPPYLTVYMYKRIA